MPVVSIIIPSYNREEYLISCIDSVLEQSFQDFELILVDDGSVDNSFKLMQSYQEKDKRVICIEQEHSGVSRARNTGIYKSKGEWIAFLDSDDTWHPEKLEKQLAYHSLHTDCQISQTEEIWIRNGKRVSPGKKHKKEEGFLFAKSLELCCITPSSVLLHRSLFEKYGVFDEKLVSCEDYELWLRISSKKKIGLISELLLNRLGGHEQLSTKYKAMDRFRVYSIVKFLYTNFTNNNSIKELCYRALEEKWRVLLLGAKKRNRDIQEITEIMNDILDNRSIFKEKFKILE
ncbi:MAG: glycosyltransferase, partial [Leptospiraceae bacterium]|nr:glycosyltransferase [Leptospiraceae bacterium]